MYIQYVYTRLKECFLLEILFREKLSNRQWTMSELKTESESQECLISGI